MEEKYTKIKEHLIKVLDEAVKLGLQVIPNGGYAAGYDKEKLPSYAVGLYGALSVVDGQEGRQSLGLTFDETQAIENGFNGQYEKRNKKQKSKYYPDLEKMGLELAQNISNARRDGWHSFPVHNTMTTGSYGSYGAIEGFRDASPSPKKVSGWFLTPTSIRISGAPILIASSWENQVFIGQDKFSVIDGSTQVPHKDTNPANEIYLDPPSDFHAAEPDNFQDNTPF